MGRVELLAIDFPPLGGGISHYLYKIVSRWPADEIRVVSPAFPESIGFDSQQPFDIHRLKVPTKRDAFAKQLKFFAPFYLGESLKHQDITFVLCGQVHYSVMLPAWILSRVRQVPLGAFAYGLDLLHPQERSYKTFFNFLLRRLDVLFVDSTAAAKIAENLAIDPSRTHVIYPSVDLDDLRTDIPAQTIMEHHNLANKKCILTVGRLIERKGHDIVIKALPLILQKVPDAHYLIVGSGPNEGNLRRLVSDLKLQDYVTFAGYVPQEKLGAYFSACDVFTMISRELPETGDIEGFGIVYLQASILGKPIVAGRSGGVPEAVLDHQTGLLVNPLDIDAVAAAIVRILLDKELAHSLGLEGRRRVMAEFGSELAARKVAETLAQVNSVSWSK